jgi:hypothetical protein
MAMMPMMAKAPKITTLLIAVFFIEKGRLHLETPLAAICFLRSKSSERSSKLRKIGAWLLFCKTINTSLTRNRGHTK